METLSYKIEFFEGPMDLLLHLISKHKVRIEDVPIMDLINQYLDYMKKLKEENLEVTSEFLEMAARLVYIKTVSLLPVHEEADRLAEELRGELTEYRDCQLMAGKGQHGYYRKHGERIQLLFARTAGNRCRYDIHEAS